MLNPHAVGFEISIDATLIIQKFIVIFQACSHLQLHEESFRKYLSKYVDKIAALCYWYGEYF